MELTTEVTEVAETFIEQLDHVEPIKNQTTLGRFPSKPELIPLFVGSLACGHFAEEVDGV